MKPAPSVHAEVMRKPAESENSAGQEGSTIQSDEGSPSSARDCSAEASDRRETSGRAVESLQHQLDQLDVCTPMANHGGDWSPWPSAARRLSWASLSATHSLLTSLDLHLRHMLLRRPVLYHNSAYPWLHSTAGHSLTVLHLTLLTLQFWY